MSENEATNKRIDDLREYISERFNALNDMIKAKDCNNCENEKINKVRFSNQWIHITALWIVVASFVSYIMFKANKIEAATTKIENIK